jgi:hypothetical protein
MKVLATGIIVVGVTMTSPQARFWRPVGPRRRVVKERVLLLA